jgi:hypothetical protein
VFLTEHDPLLLLVICEELLIVEHLPAFKDQSLDLLERGRVYLRDAVLLTEVLLKLGVELLDLVFVA